MDELKQHIIQHADEMNFDVPDAELWTRIETELQPPVKKLSVVKMVRFAAAACFIIAVGTGVWFVMNKEQQHTVAVVVPAHTAPKKHITDSNMQEPKIIHEEKIVEEPKQIAAVPKHVKKERTEHASAVPGKIIKQQNEEFISAVNEMSASFISVVNLQIKELSKTPIYGESADYYSDFKAQFYRLDEEEKELKKQIAKTGAADNALQRLIDIYQQKINILKQLQNEINKTNSRYKLSRPDDKSVSKQFINI